MPRHEGSSPYWTAVDFESEDEENLSLGRVYLNPWDLEKTCVDSSNCDSNQGDNINSSSVGEPVSASFYYVPTKTYDDCGEEDVMMEQMLYKPHQFPSEDFYELNRRKSHSAYSNGVNHVVGMNNYGYDILPMPGPPRRRSMFALEDPYQSLHHPMVYESISQGPMLMAQNYAPYYPGMVPPVPPPPPYPLPRKRTSLPVNPLEYDVLPPLRHVNGRRYTRYSAINERPPYEYLSTMADPMEDYCMCVNRMAKPAPDNFHLSRYGHLKIDYSSSWNSLDRLIRNQA